MNERVKTFDMVLIGLAAIGVFLLADSLGILAYLQNYFAV